MTSFIADDRRAIVLGASIAGLLTARVPCGRFAEVVLLERDELPERPALNETGFSGSGVRLVRVDVSSN